MTDPFDEARPGFVRLDDLLGRLLLVAPYDVEQRASTLPGAKEGDTYESITADVIVLDGPTTELIEEIPYEIEGMFISGSAIVPQLKPKIRKRGLVLGRLGQQDNRKNPKFGKAWVLEPPTEADKALARPVAQDYLARRQPEQDPFASA